MSISTSEVAAADDAQTPMSKKLALAYRKELSAGRSHHGAGAPLSEAQMVARIVSLRRRNAFLPVRYKAADKEALERLEKELPRHVAAEADRVISALTSEIRAVGEAVAAVHGDLRETRRDLRALARGDLQLEPGAS